MGTGAGVNTFGYHYGSEEVWYGFRVVLMSTMVFFSFEFSIATKKIWNHRISIPVL